VAPLPKRLGLYATSLAKYANSYERITRALFFSGDSSDRMQTQFPPNVRISKYEQYGVFPSVATIPETCRPTALAFFTELNKQKLYIYIYV
jgi:hypothetical protein